MFPKVSPWTMYFLGILNAAAENRSGKTISNVVQKSVVSGKNFTCRCSFPFSVNVSTLTVFWWKDGNRGFLKEDSRKIFMISAGGAYLHLLNVTVSDAGTYYCLVKQAGRTVADGTGEQLVVYAVPSPLKIVSVRSRNAGAHFLKIQCRTAAFYPKEFNLTWHRNGSIIQSGFRHEQHSTAEGLYEVISSLDEKRAVKEGTIYTCKIIHRSMLTPATANYTVPHEAVEGLSASLIAGSIRGAVLILMFIVIVVMAIIYRGAKKRTVNTNRTQSWMTQEIDADRAEAAANSNFRKTCDKVPRDIS